VEMKQKMRKTKALKEKEKVSKGERKRRIENENKD
jgi:hypothetical protein